MRRGRWASRWFWRATLLVAAIYLCALGVVWHQQRALMYFPRSEQTAPAMAGFAGAQSLVLTTSDNQNLVAWFRPPPQNQPTILYFHGNGGNLASEARRLGVLADFGLGIFAIDYRGYGGSTGSPTETGLLLDAEAAYARLAELGIAPEQTIVYGQSLGTGPAVAIAAQHKVAVLILEAPFSSAADVAQDRFWMFPVWLLIADRFDSAARIGHVSAPILVLHGELDSTVPVRFGEKLFALAPDPKHFIRLPGAGHVLLLLPGVSDQIHTWLEAALAPK